MTEQSSSQGRPDDWSRGGYAPGEQYAGEQYYDAGASGSARGGSGYGSPGAGYGSSGSGYRSSDSGYGSDDSGYGSSGPVYGSDDPGYGPSDPGYGPFGSGGSGYGPPGQGGSGYGSSGQGGGAGAGAVRPAQGPGQGTTGPGAAGPGLPTTPIWQATPSQGGPGQGGLGQGAPGQQGMPGQAGPGLGALPPDGAQPMGAPMGATSTGMSQAADARGFLSALFDFSFTSFVTTKIIKALYVLILVVASLVALFYTIVAFRLGTVFGFLTLVIGDPLYIIIVMAFWRLILEAFVVVFRMAEDVRAIRERGGR